MIQTKDILFYHECPVPLSRIAETYALAYKRPLNMDYWTWRFTRNPFSRKVYISYITEDNHIVSYYAVSPAELVIEGRGVYKVALSNMTMTHPHYQGRGYFVRIARELFGHLQQDGFIGVLGFANHNSHYGFRKHLNWQDISGLNSFLLQKENAARFVNTDHSVCGVVRGAVTPDILNEASVMRYTDSLVSLKRSYEGLKWRLYDNPVQSYHYIKIDVSGSRGILFYKLYKQSVDIMEFFYTTQSVNSGGKILTEAILQLVLAENKDITLWSNIHSEEHLDLERIGFQENVFSGYFGVVPFCDDLEIGCPEKWHIRYLDSDIF